MNTRQERRWPVACGALSLLLAIGLAGCKKKGRTPAPPLKSGTTVIPGTFAWDAETDTIVLPEGGGDLWWEHASPAQRFLTPVRGTEAAVVKNTRYEEIDGTFLTHWRLPKEKIAGADDGGQLAPGSVVVFRTAEGNPGKLRVVGYRSLHDFSFPEAVAFSDEWKSKALEQPNVERYHIEVEWQLFSPNGK
jgi:hypothetical protein